MELLKIFGLAVAETVETSEAGKYRLPHPHISWLFIYLHNY